MKRPLSLTTEACTAEFIPAGLFRGGEELPAGEFHGGEELPAGEFHGGEELPAGEFHGKHCTNCGGYITTPTSFKKCPMCLHKLN